MSNPDDPQISGSELDASQQHSQNERILIDVMTINASMGDGTDGLTHITDKERTERSLQDAKVAAEIQQRKQDTFILCRMIQRSAVHLLK